MTALAGAGTEAAARAGAAERLRWAWLGTVPYERAWAMQRALAGARAEGRLSDDALILLEHPPVYTLGRNTEPAHIPGGPERLRGLGAECHAVDRGGSVTFHGPGQLVAYPIVALARVFPIPASRTHGDVHRYLRALEEALVATCRACGVDAGLRPPYTGAWVGTDKVAAIGVKLAHGVTQHGVALNIATELGWFDEVVPCGIADGGTTSLERQGARGHSPASVAPVLAAAIGAALGCVAELGPEIARIAEEAAAAAPTSP